MRNPLADSTKLVELRNAVESVFDVAWAGVRRFRLARRPPVYLPRLRSIAILASIAMLGWVEMRTGVIESLVLSTATSRLHYRIEPTASSSIAFPVDGPLNATRGYSRIPDYASDLSNRGFAIHEQSRLSSGLVFLSRLGIPFPFRDKPVAGLVIRDANGDVVFNGSSHLRVFRAYREVPPLLERSLLFIENRQLGESPVPTLNPAVDWGRLVKGAALWIGQGLGLPVRIEGGSTLAVQLMKYRYSSGGRTGSPMDKLRQITAASLAAYRSGPDTEDERREVVLDYLNTVPLAAAPHVGEVNGINDGLRIWFGLDPEEVWSTLEHATTPGERAAAYKPVLALLCAVKAPSNFLRHDHAALERRVNAFAHLFGRSGVIDAELANATIEAPLVFASAAGASTPAPLGTGRKWAYAIRRDLSAMLGGTDFYALSRLDLEVETTLDDSLQARALRLFRSLQDAEFVTAHGLHGEHLLASGDPSRINYSLLLYETTPGGDRACAHVDNLDAPFDLNAGMKLELGSTAKLRTLAHYLQIVAGLHREMAGLDDDSLRTLAKASRDPITRWTAQTLRDEPGADVDTLLARALERRYSASPGESFFTGGGLHRFGNFDPLDNRRTLTVREALVRSTNLVFVRLMRDVVRWHEARLTYDPTVVLSDLDDPDRRRLLETAAEQEARLVLWRAYKNDRASSPSQLEQRILGADSVSSKKTAALLSAWHRGEPPEVVTMALAARFPLLGPDEIEHLVTMYGNPKFTLLDYAYLLGRHPLEVWLAGELARSPEASWDSLWSRSAAERQLCTSWLTDRRRVRAQNLRLRAMIERDAFERMTPEWRRLGFPFQRLVPSLATAIGASGDRPVALARLMGVILGDGVRHPPLQIERLVFGAHTPYHTALQATPQPAQRLLSVPVARTLRVALAEVVARGTAQRVSGVFVAADSTPLLIGGKTGSGDNRIVSFARGGRMLGSRSTSRTATFAFYLGERHYGVITATVLGKRSEQYVFTSALPLAVLKLLAPAIEEHLRASEPAMLTHRGRDPRDDRDPGGS